MGVYGVMLAVKEAEVLQAPCQTSSLLSEPDLEMLTRIMQRIHREGKKISATVQQLLDMRCVQGSGYTTWTQRQYEWFVCSARDAAYFSPAWMPLYDTSGHPIQTGEELRQRKALENICLSREAPMLIDLMMYGQHNPTNTEFLQSLGNDPRPGYLIIARDIVQLQDAVTDRVIDVMYVHDLQRVLTTAVQHLAIAKRVGVELPFFEAIEPVMVQYQQVTQHVLRETPAIAAALLANTTRSHSTAALL